MNHELTFTGLLVKLVNHYTTRGTLLLQSRPLFHYSHHAFWNERFANGPGLRGSVWGRVIPNTQKMVLDATLLNTQHYKVGKFIYIRITVTRKPGQHLDATYGTLHSCFDLIRSHQQCTLWSPPLETETTTTVGWSRNSTTGPPVLCHM